jgi:hypothetical protein
VTKLSVADVVPSDSTDPTIHGRRADQLLSGWLLNLDVTTNTTATIGGSYLLKFVSGLGEFGPAPGLAVSSGPHVRRAMALPLEGLKRCLRPGRAIRQRGSERAGFTALRS